MTGRTQRQEPTPDDIGLLVQDLTKEFVTKKGPAVKALRGVSLQARQGLVTGLVGADGAGKTTLIRIAAGLLVPTAGRVTVRGMGSTSRGATGRRNA